MVSFTERDMDSQEFFAYEQFAWFSIIIIGESIESK